MQQSTIGALALSVLVVSFITLADYGSPIAAQNVAETMSAGGGTAGFVQADGSRGAAANTNPAPASSPANSSGNGSSDNKPPETGSSTKCPEGASCEKSGPEQVEANGDCKNLTTKSDPKLIKACGDEAATAAAQLTSCVEDRKDPKKKCKPHKLKVVYYDSKSCKGYLEDGTEVPCKKKEDVTETCPTYSAAYSEAYAWNQKQCVGFTGSDGQTHDMASLSDKVKQGYTPDESEVRALNDYQKTTGQDPMKLSSGVNQGANAAFGDAPSNSGPQTFKGPDGVTVTQAPIFDKYGNITGYNVSAERVGTGDAEVAHYATDARGNVRAGSAPSWAESVRNNPGYLQNINSIGGTLSQGGDASLGHAASSNSGLLDQGGRVVDSRPTVATAAPVGQGTAPATPSSSDRGSSLAGGGRGASSLGGTAGVGGSGAGGNYGPLSGNYNSLQQFQPYSGSNNGLGRIADNFGQQPSYGYNQNYGNAYTQPTATAGRGGLGGAIGNFVNSLVGNANTPAPAQGVVFFDGQPVASYTTKDGSIVIDKVRVPRQTPQGNSATPEDLVQALSASDVSVAARIRSEVASGTLTLAIPSGGDGTNQAYTNIQNLIVQDEVQAALQIAEDAGIAAKDSVYCEVDEAASDCLARRIATAQEVERRVFVDELHRRALEPNAVAHFVGVYDNAAHPGSGQQYSGASQSVLAQLNNPSTSVVGTVVDAVGAAIDSVVSFIANLF